MPSLKAGIDTVTDHLHTWWSGAFNSSELGDYAIGGTVSARISIAVVVLFATSRILKLFRGLRAVHYLPGFRPAFDPYVPPGVFLPSSRFNPRNYHFWYKHFDVYDRFKSENISIIPWLFGPTTITTSNIDVTRQVVAGSSDFGKPEFARKPLELWGTNLLTAQNEVWRRHRRIIGSTFTTNLYRFIWEKMTWMYSEINEVEGWKNMDVVEIPSAQRYTFQMTLLTISTCGLGFNFKWTNPPRAADGSMSIQTALRVVADRYLTASLLPSWVLRLPIKSFRELREAMDQMTKFIQQQIKERREMIRTGALEDISDPFRGRDAFTMLVKANEAEGTKLSLSDDELVGNVYTLLFTGHETSAHTLAATFAYLSIYPDIQEEVLEQILVVVGKDRVPAFEEFSSLDRVLAVFLETLRLYPSGYLIYREADVDTTLKIPNPIGEEGSRTIPVAKGTRINIDIAGIQYNPRYFDEPHSFKPSRWYGASTENEMITGFGVGPRACLGKKFILFEATILLTLLIRDWKIEPLLGEGETLEEWKKRVFDVNLLILLGIKNVPIKLVRRKTG